ncbi:hypothetical protein WICMUC_000546 [Wickerhamomyces mucosus]|uniref:ADIPOR-like receptor IZH3 n=1 Tax=Wickerhamomyces mucosus TaxID=1378264 RepID=A0A9P8PZ00_9ASCO|nr:hypothetical protein WICMUC_000546 [Wickerhamomyces mucosus]
MSRTLTDEAISSGSEDLLFKNSDLNKRLKNSPYATDVILMQRAHSSSCSINKIIRSNSLQSGFMSDIDQFVASIENKMKRIESSFSTGNSSSEENANSLATLQNLYDTLVHIKNSAFGKSVNLERFNKVIDERYGDLLSSIDNSEDLTFHEKLLTSLRFLDSKINQFNTFIEDEATSLLPCSVSDYQSTEISAYDAIRKFELKFHNYEHASKEGSKRLLHFHELPFPWRENEYISGGYRFTNNHYHCLHSLYQCHNETVNIWTHLGGGLIMLYICFVDFPNSDLFAKSTRTDIAMIYMFLIASITCLGSSSIWHTFNGTANLFMRKKFACIDYTGITILISTSVVTTEYASLYYSSPLLRIGFVSFSLLCAISGFFFNWSSYFDNPKSKPFRIGFYILLSVLGMAAYCHLGWEKGFWHATVYYSPLLKSHVWYLIGVFFYGSLIPEIFRCDVEVLPTPVEEELVSNETLSNLHKHFSKTPHYTEHKNKWWSLWWVDYIGSSHNIWHVFVLLGVLGHYLAIYEMFENIPLNK